MAAAQKATYDVYRNITKHCYVGRSELTPPWVPMEACGVTPGGGVLNPLGPGDEWHSENGVAHMLLAEPRKFTVICLGPKKAVLEEMERLKIPKTHREQHIRWDCEGPMPKLDENGEPIPLVDSEGKVQRDENGHVMFMQEKWIGQVFEGLHFAVRDVTPEYAGAIKSTGQSMRMTNVKAQVALTAENQRLKTEKEELIAKLAKLQESNESMARAAGKSPALPAPAGKKA